MLYLIEAQDLPDALPRRLELRPRHLAYWEASGAVQIAGAMMDGDGEDSSARGSILIVEAPNATAARALLDGDPFMSERVFGPEARIIRFRPGLGRWRDL